MIIEVERKICEHGPWSSWQCVRISGFDANNGDGSSHPTLIDGVWYTCGDNMACAGSQCAPIR